MSQPIPETYTERIGTDLFGDIFAVQNLRHDDIYLLRTAVQLLADQETAKERTSRRAAYLLRLSMLQKSLTSIK